MLPKTRIYRLMSKLRPDGNVAEDEDRTLHVEVYGLGLLKQVHEHVGVLVRRTEDVLLCSGVEDQLKRKLTGPSTSFCVPMALNLSDWPGLSRFPRPRFRHRHGSTSLFFPQYR